jgi:predicted dinucleotide-binding enzyme
MARRQNDFHYIENHRFEDDKLHAAVLADGDDEAAQKVSDQVARDIGLTDTEIAALHAPQKGKSQ